MRPVPLGREPVTHSCARPLTPAEWVRALSPKAPLAQRGTSDPDTVPGAWTLTGPSLGRHPGGAAAKGAQASYPPTRGGTCPSGGEQREEEGCWPATRRDVPPRSGPPSSHPGHHLRESHSCGPQNTSRAHHVPRPAAAMPRTQRLSQTRTEPSTAPRPPESCPIPVTMPGPCSGWETEQDQKRGEEKDQKQAWATLRPVEPLPPNITALRDSPSPGSPRTPTWTSRGHRHWPSLRDSPGSEKALCPAVGGGRRSVPPPLSATLPAQYPAGSSPRSLALLSQDRGAGHPGSLRCVLKIHPVSVKAHLFRSGPPKSSLPTRDPHTSQLT